MDDHHIGTQLFDVFHNVGRENDDHVLAEQVVEAIAFTGVEAGRGLIDNDQLRVTDQGLSDPKALPLFSST